MISVSNVFRIFWYNRTSQKQMALKWAKKALILLLCFFWYSPENRFLVVPFSKTFFWGISH